MSGRRGLTLACRCDVVTVTLPRVVRLLAAELLLRMLRKFARNSPLLFGTNLRGMSLQDCLKPVALEDRLKNADEKRLSSSVISIRLSRVDMESGRTTDWQGLAIGQPFEDVDKDDAVCEPI